LAIVRGVSLRLGRTQSCGCLNDEQNRRYWKGYGEISGVYWHHLQRGAQLRKLPFEVSLEQAWGLFLQQEKRCALSGLQLTFARHWRRDKLGQTASLDRIDNQLGYVSGNVQWLHKKLNWMKHALTQEELIAWCHLVTANTSARERTSRSHASSGEE